MNTLLSPTILTLQYCQGELGPGTTIEQPQSVVATMRDVSSDLLRKIKKIHDKLSRNRLVSKEWEPHGFQDYLKPSLLIPRS